MLPFERSPPSKSIKSHPNSTLILTALSINPPPSLSFPDHSFQPSFPPPPSPKPFPHPRSHSHLNPNAPNLHPTPPAPTPPTPPSSSSNPQPILNQTCASSHAPKFAREGHPVVGEDSGIGYRCVVCVLEWGFGIRGGWGWRRGEIGGRGGRVGGGGGGGLRGLEGWGVWFGGEGGLDEGEDAWFWRRG